MPSEIKNPIVDVLGNGIFSMRIMFRQSLVFGDPMRQRAEDFQKQYGAYLQATADLRQIVDSHELSSINKYHRGSSRFVNLDQLPPAASSPISSTGTSEVEEIGAPALDVIYSPVGWGNRNVWMLFMHVKYRWDIYPVMIFRKFIPWEIEYERPRRRMAMLMFVKTIFGLPANQEPVINIEQAFTVPSSLPQTDTLSREVVLSGIQEIISGRTVVTRTSLGAAPLREPSIAEAVFQGGRDIVKRYSMIYYYPPEYMTPQNAGFLFNEIRLTPPSSRHMVKYIYATFDIIIVPLKEIRRVKYERKRFTQRRAHVLLDWYKSRFNRMGKFSAYQSMPDMTAFNFLEESTMVPLGLLSPL